MPVIVLPTMSARSDGDWYLPEREELRVGPGLAQHAARLQR